MLRLSCLAFTAAAALASTAQAGAPAISERGVDGLRLGRPLAAIRAAHLVGPVTPGCELDVPRPLGARLRAPLRGFATFAGTAPHRLVALTITGGASTTRGVAVGDPAAKALRAYPTARAESSRPGDPIQYDAVVVPNRGRDRMWFLLDRAGGRVIQIDVPTVLACE